MLFRARRAIRFLTLCLATLQLALPAVVSVLDGSVARAGRDARAHVEDVAQSSCREPHSADCAICQFLSASHGQARNVEVATVPQAAASVRATPVAVYGSASHSRLHSRAPPSILA